MVLPTRSKQTADAELDDLVSKVLEKINGPDFELVAITAMKKEIAALRSELKKKDSEIQLLKNKCDELEQYGRRNNVRIFGVAEEDDEVIEDIVINEMQDKLGVTVTPADIDRCHRIGEAVPGGKARPVIVKFTNYGARRRVFQAKKHLKGTGVSIHEDLTKTRVDLLKSAIEKYSMKQVWTADGTIIIKNGDKRYRVKSDKDLNFVIRQSPPPGKSKPATKGTKK